MGEREGLIARIRQLRRAAPAPGPSAGTAPGPMPGPAPTDWARIDSLEERITHLEQLVEGLQDSVHRESRRQSKRIAELEAQIQPAALGSALSKDARSRGL